MVNKCWILKSKSHERLFVYKIPFLIFCFYSGLPLSKEKMGKSEMTILQVFKYEKEASNKQSELWGLDERWLDSYQGEFAETKRDISSQYTSNDQKMILYFLFIVIYWWRKLWITEICDNKGWNHWQAQLGLLGEGNWGTLCQNQQHLGLHWQLQVQ